MILSNREIQKALDEGRLVINPTPLPLEPIMGGPECPYGTHSVDLKLGAEIVIPDPGTYVLDVTRPGSSLAATISKNSTKEIITEDRPYILPHTKFILGTTLEKIELPTLKAPYLAARIEGKSSRSRCGLLIHFTAPTVHPGFRGPLTLEMINLGPSDFVLRLGMPIAQLIIEEVTGEFFENESQFQDQASPEGLPNPS